MSKSRDGASGDWGPGKDSPARPGVLREPVGPKDRKVYMRRRLYVLAGLIAVVAVVVLVFLKPGSSGGTRDSAAVEVPADLQTDVTDPTDEADVPDCTAAQLAVTAVTDQTSYEAGVQPLLALSVENTGDAACAADLGTENMEFTITSGDDAVWRASDCLTDATSLAVVLDPGQPISTEPIAWVRERSSPDTCDIAREQVAAGGASYHLSASIAGVSSDETAQFLLN